MDLPKDMGKRVFLVALGFLAVAIALAFILGSPSRFRKTVQMTNPPPGKDSSAAPMDKQQAQPQATQPADDTAAIDAELNAAQSDMNSAADSDFDSSGLNGIE